MPEITVHRSQLVNHACQILAAQSIATGERKRDAQKFSLHPLPCMVSSSKWMRTTRITWPALKVVSAFTARIAASLANDRISATAATGPGAACVRASRIYPTSPYARELPRHLHHRSVPRDDDAVAPPVGAEKRYMRRKIFNDSHTKPLRNSSRRRQWEEFLHDGHW